MRVLILSTGGTIDDLEYSDENDTPHNRKSIIPDLLRTMNLKGNEIRFKQLMLRDSEFIYDRDRKMILKNIESAPEERILITHGTKTMSETAKYLGKFVKDKTVVLTGSMKLPSEDNANDAISSLKFALQAIQSLSRGVFIAMQGKIFNWDNVRKNVEQGKFELEK
jgi:L-asparaginase